jgi:hypothetical protein
MRRRRFLALSSLTATGAAVPAPLRSMFGQAKAAPSSFGDALTTMLNRFNGRYDVFTDADAAGNHFFSRARFFSRLANIPAAEAAVPPMDEQYRHPSRPGTCIRASFQPRGKDWGGWMFLNGTLRGTERAPQANFGTEPNAGVDLSGATLLTFLAAGENGGERVEFFAFGAGRNADTGVAIQPYPDSSPKATTGFVDLTRSFQPYSIDLRGRDLRYVLNGFGWTASTERTGNRPVTFYVDDISYDKPRLQEPRLPLSFAAARGSEPHAVVRNVAFTYDAAVAAIAFLALGDLSRALLIADAFVTVQASDRFYPSGWIRNGYAAGDLVLSPGWTPNGRGRTARMPGWYGIDRIDSQPKWLEDGFQVGTHTGNAAWAMLALLACYEASERRLDARSRQPYRDAAVALGNWVEAQRHPRAGYRGGFEGWEPSPKPLLYRSTEHNIDLVAAFTRLARAHRNDGWLASAEHARRFVASMWDHSGAKFWTGTLGDSDTPNTMPVPLDAQPWAILSLGVRGREDENYALGLSFAEKMLRAEAGGGFSFSTADKRSTWYEGTAQMAVAYRAVGRNDEANGLVELLRSARLADGLLPAVSNERLFTGFDAVPGEPWYYYPWAHTGATAWAVLAERAVNPFAPFPPL